MPSHGETRILPYTAQQLFDLVIDIESYPAFLPWCVGARINTRTDDTIEADVIIGYKMFRERFSSRVHMKCPHEIEVEYMQGPMRNLYNQWVFRDLEAGTCEVTFHVDFTMKTRLLEKVIDQFFTKVLARMIDAFEKRAGEIYGVNQKSV